MQLKEAVDIYQTQVTETNSIWTYFATVSTALLAVVASSGSIVTSSRNVIIIIVGYFAFCFGNYLSLRAAQQQLIHYYDFILTINESRPVIRPPFSIYEISTFYWIVSLSMIGLIVFAAMRTQPA